MLWGTFSQLAAAAGKDPVAVVMITSGDDHLGEKKSVAPAVSRLLKAGGNVNKAIMIMSGDTVADVVRAHEVPHAFIEAAVVSPHAADYVSAFGEIGELWPSGAHDPDGARGYALIDLRPCLCTDAGHAHTSLRAAVSAHSAVSAK